MNDQYILEVLGYNKDVFLRIKYKQVPYCHPIPPRTISKCACFKLSDNKFVWALTRHTILPTKQSAKDRAFILLKIPMPQCPGAYDEQVGLVKEVWTTQESRVDESVVLNIEMALCKIMSPVKCPTDLHLFRNLAPVLVHEQASYHIINPASLFLAFLHRELFLVHTIPYTPAGSVAAISLGVHQLTDKKNLNKLAKKAKAAADKDMNKGKKQGTGKNKGKGRAWN
ncbi:uncharacterized protein MELLADRAFT_110440 [Melampsora larici-populina 98AG31]|uniref:Uncharacterized protein n=1 Tax=Melampsora larici-populina (strain 98AG31 / pathotype 3-4-7) TaxID=747676 RepID=F4RZT8_MELLP|nr:uncharacterized protein MELLADRAFT_110440 [Melampsora larici-populina 98AG31]EGG02060.1 hypothetical protein MELLADRAFT_110440 [Melampsora larici-populina 98AG31]